VFELQFSNAQIVCTLPCPKKRLDQNFDSWPRDMGAQKLAKISKILSLVVEVSKVFIFAIWNHLCNNLWCRDLFGVPGTLKVGQNCQNFNFFVLGRSGLKFSRCIYAIFLGIGVHLGAQGLSKLVQIVQIWFIFVFGRRSFRFSWSTLMRLRKVSVLLIPTLGNLGPRLKPHIRLSNASLLLREAVALIRSMIALVTSWKRFHV